jgi:hypothetical protein
MPILVPAEQRGDQHEHPPLSVVAASAELAVVAVHGVLPRQRGVFTHRDRYGVTGIGGEQTPS